MPLDQHGRDPVHRVLQIGIAPAQRTRPDAWPGTRALLHPLVQQLGHTIQVLWIAQPIEQESRPQSGRRQIVLGEPIHLYASPRAR